MLWRYKSPLVAMCGRPRLGKGCFEVGCKLVGCSYVFGLFARYDDRWP